MGNRASIIYDKNTVEFVTVAVQFCEFLENAANETQEDLIDKLTKIIPLLYLKALMLPSDEFFSDEEPETFVSEYDYEFIRMNLSELLGPDDDYLEVFSPDMPYSDTPVMASISENLADIYQDVKNFVSVYEIGLDETMHSAILICKENFETYWGQIIVNVLRPLHAIKYDKDREDK